MGESHEYECNAYKIDIVQKKVQISNLNNIIGNKNSKIDSLKSSINEKSRLIECLQQDLKENNENIVIMKI